jgi:hypothetical protein
MVEAAGVEPASEIVASQETTCLVVFRRPKANSQSALRSRQDEQTTSPNFSLARPDLSGEPAHCATSALRPWTKRRTTAT